MKPTARQIANEARWALARAGTTDEERRAIRNLGILDPFETGAWSTPIPRLHIPTDPTFRPTAVPDDRTVMGMCEEMADRVGRTIEEMREDDARDIRAAEWMERNS